jgi:signal transduction histidine kinase
VTKRKSFGLLGMRERALVLGGQVDITSAPGKGTVIGVTIPINVDTAERDYS